MADFTIDRDNNTERITLAGNLSVKNINDLRDALGKLLEETVSELVFDLAKTAFVDSAGIGLFMELYHALDRKNGIIRLVNTPADIADLLEAMCLEQYLHVNQ